MQRTYIDISADTLPGNSSAAETPFGGIKESGYGKEAGKDIAVSEYMVTKSGTLTVEGII